MKKILLIEDHDEVRENTAEILALSDYKVFTAGNGKTGVEVALKEKPDLIICDIMMPLLDGYGVLHLLSKHAETSSIPFIFISAKSEKYDLRKGMEMGADDYLTKPFEGSDLLNAVETRLRRVELIRQNFSPDKQGISTFMEQAKIHPAIQLTSKDREIHLYKKKHTIYAEGQRPTAIYFVEKGKIKTYKISEDGKELITNMYGTGDFIGYTPILEETSHTDYAQVIEDAEVMIIPKADFLQLINNDKQVAKQFIKLLANNVHEKEEGLLNLAYNSLRKKVANGLVQVIDKFKDEYAGHPAIEISRENLAHVIGAAPESLIRTLSDFKIEKLIDIKHGRVVVLNENKLRHLLY